MATLKLQPNYLSSYEAARETLSKSPWYNQNDWVYMAQSGDLDQYIASLTASDKIVDADKFISDYRYDFGDSKTRTFALNVETSADRTNNDKILRTIKKDANGNPIIKNGDYEYEEHNVSDYEYYKAIIKQTNDLNYEKYLRQQEQERKDSLNGFAKVAHGIVGTLAEGVSGFAETIDGLFSTVVALGESAGGVFVGKNPWNTFEKSLSAGHGRLFDAIGLQDALLNFESNYTELRDLDGNYSGWGKYVGGVAHSLGQMAPAMLVGKGAGSISGSSKAAEITSSMVFYQAMTANSVRETYQRFAAEGVSVPTGSVLANSTIKSALQYGVEIGLAKILGGSSLDNLVFGRSTKAGAGTLRAAAGKRLLSDFVEEGLEEVFQDTSDFLVDRAFSLYINENFGKLTDLTWEGLMDSFIIGGLTSFAGSAMRILTTKRVATGEIAQNKVSKLSKLASWEYGLDLQSFYENFNKILADGENNTKYYLSNTKEGKKYAAAVTEMYAAYRMISSVYSAIGEKRFNTANDILKTITQMTKDGKFDTDQIAEKSRELYSNLYEMTEEAKANVSKFIEANMTELKSKTNKDTVDDSSTTDKALAKELLKDETIKTVAITEDGTNIVEEDGVVAIPANYADKANATMIYQTLAEQKLVESIAKGKFEGRVLDTVLETYKKIYGKEDATMNEAIVAMLFDGSFFKNLVSTSNKDMYQFLAALKSIEENVVGRSLREEVYKQKIKTTLENMKKALYVYCINQPNASYNVDLFTDTEKRKIAGTRWCNDLYNRVVLYDDAYKKLTKNDWDVLRSRVNGLPISASKKTEILNKLASSDKKSRLSAMNTIAVGYKNMFTSKYDGKTYLPETSTANRSFNTFLENAGLTIENLLSLDVDPVVKQAIKDTIGPLDENTILQFRQKQYEMFCNGKYRFIAKKNGSIGVVDTETNEQVGFDTYAQAIREDAVPMDIEKGTHLETDEKRNNLVKILLNDNVDAATAAYLSISQVITNPKLLNKNIISDIVSKYGVLNETTAFVYLRKHFIDTLGDTTVVLNQDGTYSFASVKSMRSLLKYEDTFSSVVKRVQTQGEISISEIVDSKKLYGRLKSLTIAISNNPAVYASYDPALNKILVSKDFFSETLDFQKFVLLHEYQHAVQTENRMNLGMSNNVLSNFTDAKKKAIIADVKKHRPKLFENVPADQYEQVVNDFIYQASSETTANGLDGSDLIDFYPVQVANDNQFGCTISMPWGTEYKVSNVLPFALQIKSFGDKIVELQKDEDIYDKIRRKTEYEVAMSLYKYGKIFTYFKDYISNNQYVSEYIQSPIGDKPIAKDIKAKVLKVISKPGYWDLMFKDFYCYHKMDMSYKEFLDTPLPVLRLQNNDKIHDDHFVSFACMLTPETLQYGIQNYILKYGTFNSEQMLFYGMYKPKDMLGYIGTSLNEVLLPTDEVVKNFKSVKISLATNGPRIILKDDTFKVTPDYLTKNIDEKSDFRFDKGALNISTALKSVFNVKESLEFNEDLLKIIHSSINDFYNVGKDHPIRSLSNLLITDKIRYTIDTEYFYPNMTDNFSTMMLFNLKETDPNLFNKIQKDGRKFVDTLFEKNNLDKKSTVQILVFNDGADFFEEESYTQGSLVLSENDVLQSSLGLSKSSKYYSDNDTLGYIIDCTLDDIDVFVPGASVGCLLRPDTIKKLFKESNAGNIRTISKFKNTVTVDGEVLNTDTVVGPSAFRMDYQKNNKKYAADKTDEAKKDMAATSSPETVFKYQINQGRNILEDAIASDPTVEHVLLLNTETGEMSNVFSGDADTITRTSIEEQNREVYNTLLLTHPDRTVAHLSADDILNFDYENFANIKYLGVVIQGDIELMDIAKLDAKTYQVLKSKYSKDGTAVDDAYDQVLDTPYDKSELVDAAKALEGEELVNLAQKINNDPSMATLAQGKKIPVSSIGNVANAIRTKFIPNVKSGITIADFEQQLTDYLGKNIKNNGIARILGNYFSTYFFEKTNKWSDVDEVNRLNLYDDLEKAGVDYKTIFKGKKSFAQPKKSAQREYVGPRKSAETNVQKFGYVKKYKHFQMRTELKEFINSATDKIDPYLWKIVSTGKATINKIVSYMMNTEKMNRATFDLINKSLFKNSKIKSFQQLKQLVEDAPKYYAARATLRHFGLGQALLENASPTLYNRVLELIEQDPKLQKFYQDIVDRYDTYLAENRPLDINKAYMRHLFMKYYDGTLMSAGYVGSIAKFMAFTKWKISGAITTGRSLNDVIGEDMELNEVIRDTGADEAFEQILDGMTHKEKINEIIAASSETIAAEIRRIMSQSTNTETARKEAKKFTDNFRTELKNLTDEELSARYASVVKGLSKETIDRMLLNTIISEGTGLSKSEIATKNAKELANMERHFVDKVGGDIVRPSSAIVNNIKSIDRTIRANLDQKAAKIFLADNSDIFDANLKVKPEAYETVDEKGNKVLKSDKELLALEDRIRELSKRVRADDYNTKQALYWRKRFDKEMAKLQAENEQLLKELEEAKTAKLEGKPQKIVKTIQKTVVTYEVADDVITVDAGKPLPKSLEAILENSFQSVGRTKVKYLSDENTFHVASNYNEFFEENAEILNNLSDGEVEELANFYISSDIVPSTNKARQYSATQIYLMTYILKMNELGRYALSEQLATDVRKKLETKVSQAGSDLRTWGQAVKMLEPEKVILQASAKRCDIKFSEEDLDPLVKAIRAKDVNAMQKAKTELYEKAVKQYKGVKTSVFDKLLKFERMAMLSSPGTWIRNKVSNFFVEKGNLASEAIGGKIINTLTKMFPGKKWQHEGQYKIIGTKVSSEYITFIKNEVVDSGLLDLLSDGFSKYDAKRFRTDSKLESESISKIVANGVINKLFQTYGQSLNKSQQNTLDKIYTFILNRLSDDKSINKAAVRYLGKILVEDKVDISNGLSQDVINHLSDAYVLAARDYMHKSNFLNDVEQKLKERFGNGAYFLYKQVMPFAAASANWFAEGLKYTPLGLAKSIINFAKLEQTIEKNEEAYRKGDSTVSVSPKFTQYLAIRDLGKGVIGTIGFAIGAALAACGLAGIDDEDDRYKLRVGDVYIDISEVFGSQGILTGITVVSAAKGDGDVFDVIGEALNTMFLDSTVYDLYNTFRRSNTFSDLVWNIPFESLKMFIPNIVKTVSIVSNKYNVQYSKGILGKFEKICVQAVPFIAYVFPKKYDPYTGQLQITYKGQIVTSLANKLLPFKIYPYNVTHNEKIALSVGVHKEQLTGNYTVGGESVGLTTAQISRLNEFYGQLNEKALNDFISGKTSYSVMDAKTGKYVDLRYGKMTDTQKATVIDRIMSNNSGLSKTYILTSSGKYKYYASEKEYAELKRLGISKNVYRSTGSKQGYVKIK